MNTQVDFATTSIYSLMDFYSQQQSWVTSQLDQPFSSAGPSTYDASPSPAPSISSTLSASTSFTHASSSTARSSTSAKNRRRFINSPSQRQRGPVRNMRTSSSKWARRHLPSLLRNANNSSRTHKSRPMTRIAFRMRTVTIRMRQPTQMMTATTAPPLELPAASVPLSLPCAPTPEATDLLVRYQLMIGDRMDSCMRLQNMIDEAYGGPNRV